MIGVLGFFVLRCVRADCGRSQSNRFHGEHAAAPGGLGEIVTRRRFTMQRRHCLAVFSLSHSYGRV